MVDWVDTAGLIDSLRSEWGAQPDQRLTVIGIGGFPFAGKTTFVTQFIEAVWPFPAALLPVESFILSRGDRDALGTNGCAPNAYKIEELREAINSLKSRRSVEINEYSWDLGRLTGKSIKIESLDSGFLFVDGTITVINELAQLMNYVCVFVPEKRDDWKKYAVERDSKERNWAQSDAKRQNILKEAETNRLLNKFHSNVTSVVKFEYDPDRYFKYVLTKT